MSEDREVQYEFRVVVYASAADWPDEIREDIQVTLRSFNASGIEVVSVGQIRDYE